MRAADTNVLVRLFARDDDRQAALAEEFIDSGAWISHVVLAETVWVLMTTYDRTHAQAAAHVQMLLDHERFVLQDRDVVEAALEHYLRRPSLGFTDCLILEIARKAGHMPLGTFDRNLAKLPGAQRL
jgi:predicted nucleic-acid-binding protein